MKISKIILAGLVSFFWTMEGVRAESRLKSKSIPAADLSDLPTDFKTDVNLEQAGASSGEAVVMRLRGSCYGTNLRSVDNPLNPQAKPTFSFNFNVNGASLSVKLGDGLFFAGGSTNLLSSSAVVGSQTYTCGTSIPTDKPCVINVEHKGYIEVLLDKNQFFGSSWGSYDISSKMASLRTTLTQDMGGVPQGSYTGRTGTVSVNPSIQVSSEGIIDIQYTVPGSVFLGQRTGGFCGSYYSPIMLSFSNQHPEFKSQVKFPIHPMHAKTYWPSEYKNNYFLAYDVNKDGVITSEKEIFGDQMGIYKNGFEKLASLDSHKDGIIDFKDKVFSDLKLWQDRNNNGVGEASELVSLVDKRVVWISLKHKNVHAYMTNAQLKETSAFSYKTASGEQKVGQANDFWFAPAGEPKLPSVTSVKKNKVMSNLSN